MYHCTCLDHDIGKNLCKHIHKVHSLIISNLQIPRSIPTETDDNDMDSSIPEPIVHHTDSIDIDYEEKHRQYELEQTKNALDEIYVLLRDENVLRHGLRFVRAKAEEVKLHCKILQDNQVEPIKSFNDPGPTPSNWTLEKMQRTSKKKKMSKNVLCSTGKDLKETREKLIVNRIAQNKSNENCETVTDVPCNSVPTSQKVQALVDVTEQHGLKEPLVSNCNNKNNVTTISQIGSILPTNMNIRETILRNSTSNLSVLTLKSLELEMSNVEL